MAAKDFMAWGVHSVLATLRYAPACAMELWTLDNRDVAELGQIRALALEHTIPVHAVPAKTLSKISDGAAHQGVVLKRRPPETLRVKDYLGHRDGSVKNPFLLVLDQVQDPRNFGACLRVADGAGVDAVMISRDHSAPVSGVVAKSASGALDTVPLISAPNLARGLDELREAGIWIFGAAHDADQSIYASDFDTPLALVFGSEGDGLRRLTRSKCDFMVRVPLEGRISSLNVSTAVAVGAFEVVRQRTPI